MAITQSLGNTYVKYHFLEQKKPYECFNGRLKKTTQLYCERPIASTVFNTP